MALQNVVETYVSPTPLAVITGANHESEADVATALAIQGYDLYVVDQGYEIAAVAADLENYGTEVHAFDLDLNRGLREFFAHVHEGARDVTVLVLAEDLKPECALRLARQLRPKMVLTTYNPSLLQEGLDALGIKLRQMNLKLH